MSVFDPAAILSSAGKDESQTGLGSISVSRPLDPETIDLGHLVLIESNGITDITEDNLAAVARDNAQVINSLQLIA